MRRKWMPFALAAIIAASAAITPVYADDPPSGSLPSSFEGYRPSGSDAAGGVYLMLTEETIQNWTRPRGESPSQTPSSAAVRRGAKRFQNGVEKISTLTEAVEDMTPGSSPYANISPGMEFIDNILTGIGATSEMVKHPGAERIGTAAEVTQGVIQSQPVVDYIAENKHPIIDFMDQMTIDMNWGITELFGGDGDAYIRNIRDNGYESLAGDFNAFDDVQGQNWQDWRIAQLYQRYAELIAAGKEAEVRTLQKQGRVAMVGDGINDAPALTRAETGIAIGAGADVALDAADVVLVRSDLADVPAAVRLSRAVVRNIHQNLFWAFFYNAICIPLAAGVFTGFGITLNPMIASAAMSLSSVCVVTNALRLNTFDPRSAAHDAPPKRKAPVRASAPEIPCPTGSCPVQPAPENKTTQTEGTAMKKTIHIEGMMCGHCEATVKKALEALDGVQSAEVSHEKGTAVVSLTHDVADADLKTAVEARDYTVTGIDA